MNAWLVLVLIGSCERVRDWWEVDLGGDIGDACESAADCQPELACANDGTCQTFGQHGTTGYGQSCTHSDECAYGTVCSGHSWTCAYAGEAGTGAMGDTCGLDADCEVGFVCEDDDTCQATGLTWWPGVDCEGEDHTAPFRVLFEVPWLPAQEELNFYGLPFSTDVRAPGGAVDLSGHPRPGDSVPTDLVDLALLDIDQNVEGYGLNPTIYLRFSRKHIVDTLRAFEGDLSNIRYADITPTSPDYGPRSGYAWRAATGRGRYICHDWVAVSVHPGQPLRPDTTYAVYITDTVQAEDGDYVRRDEDFDAVMQDDPPDDQRLLDAWEAHAPLRDYLDDQGLLPDAVVGAAVFTTGNPAGVLSGLAETVAGATDGLEPTELTLCDDGVVSPCDDGGLRECEAAAEGYHELHGRFELPSFQSGTAPYSQNGGGWTWDADGLPFVHGTEEVCFALTVPTGEAPAAGWPVAVVAHGADDGFRAAVDSGLASVLAAAEVDGEVAARFATLTIDLPGHGSRARGSAQEGSWLFENPDNPDAALGNALQASADLHALLGWLDGGGVDASLTGTEHTFDPEGRVLVGLGLGARPTTLTLAWSDEAVAGVLDGGGAYRIESMVHAREPVDLKIASEVAVAETRLDRFHPMLNLLQLQHERGDPVCYGGQVLTEPPAGLGGKHLLAIYRLGDPTAPDETQIALHRSLRLPTAGDVSEDYDQSTTSLPVHENYAAGLGRLTAASIQVDDGEDVSRQVEHFLATAVTEDAPTIPR